ncbi:MAG TPA: hypothetical protein VFO85_16310 [Vicinamibacteria bacterium]|nr:hypothetical protein [Vicinamibacteria bacterium]
MRSMRLSRLLPAVAVLALVEPATTAAAQGATRPVLPADAYLLPADSAVVFAADVRGFFASRLWAQVNSGELGSAAGLTPEKSAEMAREAQEGMAKGMAEMEAEMGFRADRDVDWVFFGLQGTDGPTPQGVAVITGRFDADRILQTAEAAQAKGGSKATRRQVGAVTLLATEKNGKPDFTVAVPSPQQLVIGDGPLVEAVLAARAARRQPLQANAALKTRLMGAQPGGIFMVASETLMQKMGQGGAPPPVPLPRSAALALAFDGAIEMTAEMATAADAQNALSTIQGQLGMISALMAQNEDPQKAMAGKLLAGLKAEAQGSTLRISAGGGELGLGALAALAIPGMLRARVSANESAALGDIRTVISGEAAYQSANAGFYGELPCLGAPATCLKGYSGPGFLDAQLTSLQEKSGYRRAFHPGPRGPRARSLRSYAYTAVPVEPGKTGVRSFCGESSGVIRFDPSGGDIRPVGGLCPGTLAVVK